MKRLFGFVLLALSLLAFAPQSEAAYVGPRRALLSSCPQGSQIGGVCAPVVLNFGQGSYYVNKQASSLSSLVSVSRASTKTCAFASGVLISVGANVPCITDQGFLIEEARTNKNTNFNANPTDLTNVTKSGDAAAVLSVVDDTAALLAAGLQNIATSGKVYKLDNSLGVGAALAVFGGTTGNTNAAAISVYARITTGLGSVRLANSGTFLKAITGTTYGRFSTTGTPGATTDQLDVRAEAGAVIFFTLNQLEEGAFVTSPIVIAGASATRAADVPQLIGPAAAAALAAKAMYVQTNLATVTTTNRLFAYDGASGVGNMLYPTSTTTVQITNGTNSANATFGSGTNAGLAKLAFGFDATSMTAVANGGIKGTSANAWVTGTTPYLGNISTGVRALNGYMQRFAISPNKGQFDGATVP